MTTNHRKVRILPILDKIIAYLRNQSQKRKEKKRILRNLLRKNSNFSSTCGENIAKFDDFR